MPSLSYRSQRPVDANYLDVVRFGLDDLLSRHFKDLANRVDNQFVRQEQLILGLRGHELERNKVGKSDEEISLLSHESPPSSKTAGLRKAATPFEEKRKSSYILNEPRKDEMYDAMEEGYRAVDRRSHGMRRSDKSVRVVEVASTINGADVIEIASHRNRMHGSHSTNGSQRSPAMPAMGSEKSWVQKRGSIVTTQSIEDERRKTCARNKSHTRSIASYTSFKADKSCLVRVVESEWFATIFATLIITNAVFVGAEVEWQASYAKPMEDPPASFTKIGYTYALLFLIELALRIGAEKRRFFVCGKEKCFWNYLDLFLVLTSVVEVITDLAEIAEEGSPSSSSDQQTGQTGSVRLVRVLRITRLLRIVRIVRVVRFVRALRTLVQSIASTLKSLFWAMLLLSMIIYVFGIVFTQAATQHYEDGQLEEKAKQYWSSLPRSFLTLFKSVSGGLSWQEAIVPLGSIHWICVGLFLVFVTFTYFAVLNVVTGVFCQSAIESAQHDYDLVIQNELRNRQDFEEKIDLLFRHLDVDDSGQITLGELERFLAAPAMQAYFASLGLDPFNVWTLFKLLDEDQSCDIDVGEFLRGCMRLRGTAKAVDLAKLDYDQKAFRKKVAEFIVLSEAFFEAVAEKLELVGRISEVVRESVTIVRKSQGESDGDWAEESQEILLS